MGKNFYKYLWIKTLFLFFFCANFVWAGIGFVNNNIWLSNTEPLAGDNIKIYSVVVNDNNRGIEGYLRFYDNGKAISDSLFFVLGPDGTSKVLAVYWEAVPGSHQFKAELSNLKYTDEEGGDVPRDLFVSQTTEMIFVDSDSDNDGIPNQKEISMGLNPDNADSDGDGEADGVDPDPADSRVFNGPDTDKDGISDYADSDKDNDGLFAWEEEELGTSDYKYDSDGDGYADGEDVYPIDKDKWQSSVVENPKEAVIEVKAENEEVVEVVSVQETEIGVENDAFFLAGNDYGDEDVEGVVEEYFVVNNTATTSGFDDDSILVSSNKTSLISDKDKDLKTFVDFVSVFFIGFLALNMLLLMIYLRDKKAGKKQAGR